MEWWNRLSSSMRNVLIGVATRLGLIRRGKTGLGRLRREVSACEYEDVHVMWEMLKKTDTRMGRFRAAPPPRRRRSMGNLTMGIPRRALPLVLP